MGVEDGAVFLLHVVEDTFLLVRMPRLGDFELFRIFEYGVTRRIRYRRISTLFDEIMWIDRITSISTGWVRIRKLRFEEK